MPKEKKRKHDKTNRHSCFYKLCRGSDMKKKQTKKKQNKSEAIQ